MTDVRKDDWNKIVTNAYIQQKVINPAGGQSPNNSRFAIWHFSKLYNLRKYENPPRWSKDDGRGRRGDKTIYPFLCNVQPINRNDREYEYLQQRQADRQRALIYVTYDPFIINEINPMYTGSEPKKPMYPDGIFIRTGDDRAKIGDALGNTFQSKDLEVNHAHSDILEYDGLKWEALWVDRHNGGDEDLQSYVGRNSHAIMGLWEDEAHEAHASVDNREVFTEY